jgi:hypothetical protein
MTGLSSVGDLQEMKLLSSGRRRLTGDVPVERQLKLD